MVPLVLTVTLQQLLQRIGDLPVRYDDQELFGDRDALPALLERGLLQRLYLPGTFHAAYQISDLGRQHRDTVTVPRRLTQRQALNMLADPPAFAGVTYHGDGSPYDETPSWDEGERQFENGAEAMNDAYRRWISDLLALVTG